MEQLIRRLGLDPMVVKAAHTAIVLDKVGAKIHFPLIQITLPGDQQLHSYQ
jgi:hypothetical protein